MRAAENARRIRYAAATTAAPPQALGSVSALDAEMELAEAAALTTLQDALPDLFAPGAPAPGWVMPRKRSKEPTHDDAR